MRKECRRGAEGGKESKEKWREEGTALHISEEIKKTSGIAEKRRRNRAEVWEVGVDGIAVN